LTDVYVVELNKFHPRPFVFSEAADCLTSSLRELGLSVTHVYEGGQPGLMLVLGLFQTPADIALFPPDRTILFNFEILNSQSVVVTHSYRELLNRYRVIDYSDQNLVRRPISAPASAVWPVVPPPISATPRLDDRLTDVLFFGSSNTRRSEMLDRLGQRGIRVERVSGAYGIELRPALTRARLVLNLHYYEDAVFPPLRVVGPYALGLPIVMEASHFSVGCDWTHSGIRLAHYDELLAACERELEASTHSPSVYEQRTRFRSELQSVFETRARAFLGAIV